MTIFPVSKVNALRRRAAKACPEPKDAPDGWSRSTSDPMKLLRVFKSLQMKPGFVLRAYQYSEGGNGNGFIWAMPESAPFPYPEECSRLKDVFLQPPKPPQALDQLMDAIDGDGSPWSYLSASLFDREAAEFGAMWHGCEWSEHDIIGADPWQSDFNPWGVFDSLDEWTWNESKPETWEPSFVETDDSLSVSFLTFSGLGTTAIYRHTNTFKSGSYAFNAERATVAEGPGGFIH